MGISYTQMSQKPGHFVRAHRSSQIAVGRNQALYEPLFVRRCLYKPRCKMRRLFVGSHPSHQNVAEVIQDLVEVKIDSLGRPFELGDVPGPHMIGPSTQKLTFLIARMAHLVRSLPHVPFPDKDRIPGAHRANTHPIVQQCRIDRPRTLVHEGLAVPDIQHLLPPLSTQRSRRSAVILGKDLYMRRFHIGIKPLPMHGQLPKRLHQFNILRNAVVSFYQLSRSFPLSGIPRSFETFSRTLLTLSYHGKVSHSH